VNDAFTDLTGLRKNELAGTAFSDLSLLNAKNKALLLENLAKRMQGIPVDPYEINFRNRAGEARCAEVKAKKINYAGNPADLVIFHDITRRKENARRLKEYSEKMEALVNEKVKEVKESEEKFRNLSEESPNMIFIYKKGRVIYANKKCEDLMGYTKEEFYAPAFNFFTLIAPESQEKLKSSHKRHAEGEEVAPYAYTLVTKAGKRISAVLTSKLIKYEGENATLGIVTDITERKKAENELQEARERYSSLFDRAPLGILVIDPETFRIVEFNNVAHQQLGYSREEFSKLSIPDFEVKETADEIRNHINNILSERRGEFETKHKTKDGNLRDVLVTTKPIILRGKTYLQCIFHDITEIRKVQDALMKSESKYRQLVELAQEGIWALDKSLKTVFVNLRMAQMLGYSQGEMAGKSLFEFLDKGITEQANHFLRQFKKGIKGQFECAFPRKDGTRIYTSIAASNIKDDQGRSIGTLALVADITERKRAEEALKESEERARAIVANAPIGIATSSADKHFLSANEAFCKILGYTEDELGKLTFKDITHPEDLKESVAKMEELEAGRISFFMQEKRYVKKDGNVINGKIMVSAMRDQAGNPSLFIAELEDITERKKMEDELRQERDMLEAVTENIGAGLAIISKDYHILWANKLMKQINGDCEGKKCYSTFNKLTDVCPNCGVKEVFEKGVPIDIHEYSNLDDKDNRFWIELIVTPIKDEKGKVTAGLELAINITERKLMQNKLAEYSQKLEKLVEKRTEQLKQTQAKLVKSERLAVIGELAAMVGHDLRNPLTGIKGAAYYLKTKHYAELGAKGNEMLKSIENAINYSNKIVNDLLEYSRNPMLDIGEVTPRTLLKKSLSLLEVPDDIQIVDATETAPLVKADIEKMCRVFVNIIRNAIDAMPEGGTLTVKSREVKGKLEIAFKDTGTGISKENLDKLKRGVPLFTTKAKGMGFGLPICKRIAEAHGGKIALKSKIGKGTTVTVTVLVNPTSAKETEDYIVNVSMLPTIDTTQERP
jgi:two-component system sensor histidine kinase/response regulator